MGSADMKEANKKKNCQKRRENSDRSTKKYRTRRATNHIRTLIFVG